MKRARTIPRHNRLPYQLGAMRFADLSESFHTIVELLVSYLTFTDADHAILLRALFLVNRASRWIVYYALRAAKATYTEDMGFTFCRLSRCCELCGRVPKPIPVQVRLWDRDVGEHVDDVLLCGRCSDRSTVMLQRVGNVFSGFVYWNRWSVPITPTVSATRRLDERLLDPTSGVAGIETFIQSLKDEPIVTLLVSNTPEHRFLTRRLRYCDARPTIDAFQPELDRLDVERRADESAFVQDKYTEFRDHLASHGVDFALDPPLTTEEVRGADVNVSSKTPRLELARLVHLHMKRHGPTTFAMLYQNLCDRLRRCDIHPSFGWIKSWIPVESQLDLCRQILSNGCLRVCRFATTVWEAKRGKYPETEVVVVGIEFSFAHRHRQRFLIHSTPATVDALGDCCASSMWRSVPTESFFSLETLLETCTWHRPGQLPIAHMLHVSATPDHKRHKLPERCVHVPPPDAKRAWWRLTSCSVCKGGPSLMQ